MSKFVLVSGALATTMAASDSFVPIYDVSSGGQEALIAEEIAINTADVLTRRLDVDQFQDVVSMAIDDVRDARDQFLVTVAEFKAFSPSELLADLARQALQKRDEEPPRNLRERLARRARDAVIEQAISTLESVGKRQEAEVRDFLEMSVQETQNFVTEEGQEWKDFFDANAEEAKDFFEGFNPVEDLIDDPWLAIDKQFWADNGGELKDFLGENAKEAGDFFMEQVNDAVEFVTVSTAEALDVVESNVDFILESVDRILDLAEQLGIKHPALDALKEFTDDPQKFLADAVRELIDEKLIDPLTAKARDVRIQHPALDTLKEFSDDPRKFLADAARELTDEKLIDPLTAKARDVRSDLKVARENLHKDAEATFDRVKSALEDGEADIQAELEKARDQFGYKKANIEARLEKAQDQLSDKTRSILDRLDLDLVKEVAGAGRR